ncbi:hypothetical protein [Aestuariirhabdus litorea]|uniref:Glycosyltransferase RgtA/B/C/D-like domain-containing protein n=1 Tax=Aestuariirhabdus litorea TaxID=2528527 RepID=A0A3P3VX85_9GAMM|nr:hypothetical protein [Aestuariirhabdus litorea]RRJ85303.1 hypothetical protein D0544_09650 [Aestuariirhabdus litorea]RWW98525.1 hypothetical protein DZC74_09635 [Endozoicomonadaceae bacterium GTF-13]
MKEGLLQRLGQQELLKGWGGALALVFLAVALVNLLAAFEALSISHVVSRYEGFVYDGIVGLLAGGDLYPEWHQHLYRYRVYNPLTYLPTAWLSDSPDQALWRGRLISWGAALLLAALLAWWGRKQADRLSAVLLFGLFFTIFGLTVPDFFRLRPESLAMLLGFLGWYLAAQESRRSLALAALCCLLAFAVKQSYILIPATIFAWLLIQRRWRDLLTFTLLMLAGLTVIYLLMGWFWGVAAFQHTLLAMGSNAMTPFKHAAYYGPMLFQRYPGFWVAALIVLLWCLPARSAPLLLRVSLPLSLLWTFMIAGKAGASDSYFGELVIFLLLALGVALRQAPLAVRVLVLAALSLQAWQSGRLLLEQGSTVVAQYEDRGMPVRRYADHYRAFPGTLLLVDERLSIQSQRVVAIDWFLLELLERSGRIELEPLFQQILAGRFDKIVFDQTAETGLERYLYQLTRHGPYRQTFSNAFISEWTRVGYPPPAPPAP